MPLTGFEPVPHFCEGILSPSCLPISPQRRKICLTEDNIRQTLNITLILYTKAKNLSIEILKNFYETEMFLALIFNNNSVLAAVFRLVHYPIGGFKQLFIGNRFIGSDKSSYTEINTNILTVDLNIRFICEL